MLLGIIRSINIGIPGLEVNEKLLKKFEKTVRNMFRPLPTRVSIVELEADEKLIYCTELMGLREGWAHVGGHV